MKVDPSVLRELLEYDKDTGVLVWKTRDIRWFAFGNRQRACRVWNSRYAGKVAFTAVSTTGYYYGRVFDVAHFTHRVAFAIMEGYYPDVVDQINGNRLDNRWINLRPATKSDNARNVSPVRGGTSRYLGVSWNKKGRGKWYACITLGGKTVSLGRYDCEIEAARAYDAAALLNYGEFARLNFPEMVR